MEKIIFNIPYDDNKAYKQFIKFLNFSMNLTDQEQTVLAKLIEYNIEYKELEVTKRAKFINSSLIKKEISEITGIKVTGLSQVILRLKKKKFFKDFILNENGEVNSALLLIADSEGMGIEINFLKSLSKTTEVEEQVEEISVKEEITKTTEITDDDKSNDFPIVEEEEFNIKLHDTNK